MIKHSFVPIGARYLYRNCLKLRGFEFPCSRPISIALLEVGPFTMYRINARRRSLARKHWISRSCAKASIF